MVIGFGCGVGLDFIKVGPVNGEAYIYIYIYITATKVLNLSFVIYIYIG